VLCQQGWPLRQQDWPFGLKETQMAHGTGFWECSMDLDIKAIRYYICSIERPVVSKKSCVGAKVGRGCHKEWPSGATATVFGFHFGPQNFLSTPPFSGPSFVATRVPHGQGFWQYPRALLMTCNAEDQPRPTGHCQCVDHPSQRMAYSAR
jgi:hypothetical protein